MFYANMFDLIQFFFQTELKYPEDVAGKNYSRGVSVIWKNLHVNARIKKQRFIRSATYEEKDIIKNGEKL